MRRLVKSRRTDALECLDSSSNVTKRVEHLRFWFSDHAFVLVFHEDAMLPGFQPYSIRSFNGAGHC